MSSPSTDWIRPSEALAHVLARGYLRLFVTIGIGWLLLQIGTAVFGFGWQQPTPDGWALALLFGFGLAAVGAGIAFVGVVATVYKLLLEVRLTAEDRSE